MDGSGQAGGSGIVYVSQRGGVGAVDNPGWILANIRDHDADGFSPEGAVQR
jgi:hypothetical protein